MLAEQINIGSGGGLVGLLLIILVVLAIIYLIRRF
jgi:hypothetical protein